MTDVIRLVNQLIMSRPSNTEERRAQITGALTEVMAKHGYDGATVAAQHLKDTLGVGFNETTADGAITLKEGECMGACGDAPVLLVNNKRMCSWMTPEKLDVLVKELRK